MTRLLITLLLMLALPAHAEYPSQPITIVVPFPSGGGSDRIARAIGAELSEILGQRVVQEHAAGGAGLVGAMRLKAAAPDGHTIMVGSIGIFATNPALRNLPYDPLRDFDLLTLATREPNLLVVHPSVPANDLAELIAYLKSSPGVVRFADGGRGSSDHLATALFWRHTGTSGVHMHHKGAGPATTALRSGEADAGFLNFNLALPEVRAGRLKAIAFSAEPGKDLLPNVPTLKEAGIDGFEIYAWQGIAAPKHLPPEVKTKLHRALVQALVTPSVRNRLVDDGLDIVANTPEEFEQMVRDEIDRWRARHYAAGW